MPSDQEEWLRKIVAQTWPTVSGDMNIIDMSDNAIYAAVGQIIHHEDMSLLIRTLYINTMKMELHRRAISELTKAVKELENRG